MSVRNLIGALALPLAIALPSRRGCAYTIAPGLISRPGPRLVQAAQEPAAHLYPDIFE